MEYQLWSKEDYGDNWTKVDCGDLEAAKREIDKAVRASKEPILTVTVPYTLSIKVLEVGSEVKKDETKSDKSTRDKGNSKVRRGDEGDTEKLDQPDRDPGAGDLPGD